ncbi:MAG: cytochrome P450 [bacterium]|nr:cytochrome P450 [bacterium]
MTNPLPTLEELAREEEPWAGYARLRDEAPIYRPPAWDRTFVLSRYDDVRAVLADSVTFSSSMSPNVTPAMMVHRDGEPHDRLRRVMAAAFTPRAIEVLAPGIERVAASSLDALIERGGGDLVPAWCQAIPVSAIAEILSVPPERQPDLRRWALDLLSVFFAQPEPGEQAAPFGRRTWVQAECAVRICAAMGPRLGGELLGLIFRGAKQRGAALTPRRLDGCRGLVEFVAFLNGIVRQQRRAPRGNVLDMLIEAMEPGEDGVSQASEVEILLQGLALIVAGVDTTATFLGNGVRVLCERPELYAELRANPDSIDAFASEVLRLWSPVQWTDRRATRAVEIHGQTIPTNAQLKLFIGAANRDPDQYEAADELRLDRGETGDLSFAVGPHACIGRNLALLEGRRAFRILLARTSGIHLEERPQRTLHPGTYGFEELRVKLERA